MRALQDAHAVDPRGLHGLATGIGAWTEDIFVKTIKSGRHWGAARPILPPMPWQSYSQLSDDDLKAIYAYVRSLGEPGVAAPAYVAPGGKVNTPYFVFVPQVDQKTAAK
mgnify:CR=1 FL=1